MYKNNDTSSATLRFRTLGYIREIPRYQGQRPVGGNLNFSQLNETKKVRWRKIKKKTQS